jgi:hypothetical protein
MLSISIASASASDESLELTQPSFKFFNISPMRLGVNQNLTQDFAKAIYNDTPELKTAEITGRKGDMQINPDGTKTMETGSKKMIYRWNSDLNIINGFGEVLGEVLINTISAAAD